MLMQKHRLYSTDTLCQLIIYLYHNAARVNLSEHPAERYKKQKLTLTT